MDTDRRRAYRHTAVLLVSCLALGPIGCDRGGSSAGAPATVAITKRPNIVLISMDTTRADYLGCYGHPGGATPRIDRLASEGMRFARCESACPMTLPSHATMFTGSYPFVHGARGNMTYHLAENNDTIAELASRAGYGTYGVVGSMVLGSVTGINQGFDRYVDVTNAGESRDEVSQRMTREAKDVTNEGISFLDQVGQKPFFVFLHYYDPHWPYEAPPEFAKRFDDDYLAEIAYTDAEIGRFLDTLEAKRFARTTVVFLTGDHGEGRGDHNEDSHSYFLYETTQHVPLIVWSPGSIAPGQVIESQVREIDIAPTIAALLGAPRSPQMQGVNLLDPGRLGQREPDLPAYAETFMGRAQGYSQLRAFYDNGWKYIHAPHPLLFHLTQDPGETANLAAAQPQRVTEMREQLRNLIAKSPPPPSGRGTRQAISPERLEQLEALGYVGGELEQEGQEQPLTSSNELDDFEPKGVDPLQRADEIRFFTKAAALINQRKYDMAADALSRAVQAHPDSFVMWGQYADCLAKMYRPEDAIAAYKRTLELKPDSPKVARKLARWLAATGKKDEALDWLMRAHQVSPSSTELNFDIGLQLSELQRPSEAVPYFQQALHADAMNLQARMWLARAFEATGQVDEAAEQYHQLTEIHPKAGAAYLAWSEMLIKAGRFAEAATVMNTGIEQMPANPRLGEQLAWLLATCPDAAVRDGARAVEIATRIRDESEQPSASVLDTLAAALAETGEFKKAQQLATKAGDAAAASKQTKLEHMIRQRIELYAQGQPYRE